MYIIVAGKNNIAVDVLEYLITKNLNAKIGVICNKNETGVNSWQKSLRWFSQKWGIEEYSLDEIYNLEKVVFLSMEFDQIVRTDRFKNAKLYNIHFSLLPAYKGMYTSVLPILNGEKTVGVTFHSIDNGIDTGEIIAQTRFDIGEITSRELYLKYIKSGTQLVISNIDSILNNQVNSFPQSVNGSTYYSRKSIDFHNLSIDFYQTAQQVSRQIRAFTFREYQLMPFNNKRVVSARITPIRSKKKPGYIFFEDDMSAMVSTVDYNIILYFDRFEELIKSCTNGDYEKVQEICQIKEHINAKDNEGNTPLAVATYYNQIKIALRLISIGADIYSTNNVGENLLLCASKAYLRYHDKTLFKMYQQLGLSDFSVDYFGNDISCYIKE